MVTARPAGGTRKAFRGGLSYTLTISWKKNVKSEEYAS